jgi:hypothetical protein
MLNSEKMIASIEKQDLHHADKYLKKALNEDPAEVLVELAEYLESIGFLPQAQEIYEKVRFDFPEVNVNLAQIAAEDGNIEEAFLYLDAIPEESEDYLSALIVKADLYQMEGLTDVARDKLLEASQLSDDSLIILVWLRWSLNSETLSKPFNTMPNWIIVIFLQQLAFLLMSVSVSLMPVLVNLKLLVNFWKKPLKLNTMTPLLLN